jgi:hypothetical protein
MRVPSSAPGKLSIGHVIQLVAAYDNMHSVVLTEVVKGPKKGWLARKVAMYLCL